MKTKISHLGRSTVSVILAVMMLLSTMLIGTVSTVNAATSTKKVFLLNAANWKTPKAYCWDGGNNNTWPGTDMTKEGTLEGSDVYSFTPKTGYSKIIFNDSGDSTTQTATLDYPTTDNQMYNNKTKKWTTYSDSNSVAQSVSLTASANPVQVGTEVTLTASLNNIATGLNDTDVTYTFEQTSGATVTGTPTGNTYKFTPTSAGDYTFKVTASAANYSSVANTVTVTATSDSSDKYAIYVKLADNVNSYSFSLWAYGDPDETNAYGYTNWNSKDTFTINDHEWHDYQFKNNISNWKLIVVNGSTEKKYDGPYNCDLWITVKGDNDYDVSTTAPTTTYTINYDVKGGNGSLTATGVNGSGSSVNSGTTVIFTAAPSEGYAVEGWYSNAECTNKIDSAGTNNTYEVTVNANTNVYVKFKSTTIDPEYRLTGDLSAIGGWKGYSEALKFDTAESDGSYSKVITVTDDDVNNKFFKLINKSETYYGPNDSAYNIISSDSSDTAYNTYENSGEGKDFYFNKAGTYKIHYFIDTTNSRPSVWVEENTTKYNVTVAENIKSIASVDKTKAAKDEKVTVTATPGTGEVLESVTVEGADNNPVTTTVSGNTATFTMPDQDVTVTGVNFREAKTCKVTFRPSDEKYGEVTAQHNGTAFTSGKTVTEGDTVTFTATPSSGYTFTGWTVNGASAPSTDNPYTITVNKDTTVVANFNTGTLSGYYLLCGEDPTFKVTSEGSSYKSVPLYKNEKGEYYADFDAANITKKKDYYIIFSTKEDTSGIIVETNNVTINTVDNNGFSLGSRNDNVQNPNGGSNNVKFAKVYINSDDVTGFTIKITGLDLDKKKITYSAEPKFDVAPADTVEITAKDGTIRAGFTDTDAGKTTAVLGDTTLSITTPDGEVITASDSYEIDGKNRAVTAKKVPNGSTVTVTTKINPEATFAGHKGSDYYVKGFSVNGIFGGVLSQTEGKNHSSDVYTYTFTVNQEIYDSSKLEITPVYFLKNDDNCVYFYIENYDSAKQIWGNTPSCYVYYGSGKTTLEALGYYPGQPMVDYNGSIFTQIPKSIVNGDTTEKITGMTLNNYVWDDVHRDYNGKDQKSDNAQTYDYDDFVKIAESGAAADNIIYRFKYNTHDNVPGDTLATSDTDAAGWEVFLDYQNYPTDIFGNKIGTEKLDYKDTQSVTSKDNYLSIISDGYQNNYIGKYATAWSIYNKAGDRVATIPSSALLYALGKTDAQIETAIGSESTPTDFLPGKDNRDKHWETFKTLYNDYKGVYAQINFEAAIKGGDDYGNRLDGRWYYSQSKQKITGEIKIQYANTLDDYKVGGFHEDTFADEDASSIVGTTTGASAYFTDPADRVRKLETEADNTQDYKFEVNATSTAAYTFVGWYRLIDGDYKAINPSDMSSLTGAVTRNSDVTLVARYIKTPGGSMTFHHSLYNGTNAGGGKATTEIQVVVKNNEGKSLYDSGRIAGTASIDKTKIAELAAQTGLTVTVTLYTTTKNLYNFNGYYSAENTTDITAFNPTTGFTTNVSGDRTEGLVTTSEYTFSFNEYYNKYASTLTAADAGTVYYNFYSDITSIKVPYKVQFSYTDRMGNQKYYNKAGYVDPENTSSYTFDENATNVEGVESHSVKVTLTDSFILSLAPYESNFTKNLTWNETPISNTAFDSSVTNSIASAVVNSTQSDRTIHLNVFRDNNGKPTPLINDAGQFKLYEKDGSPELPYGSVFYTKKDDGTYTYDITAQKTYTDESGKELQFMYWAIYSDPECKNLVINAYNSEGAFSYVAYDNCWIVPVYGESSTPVASVKDVYTSTQFMEVTRNQWTADKNSSFDGFDADSMTTLDTAEDFIKGNGEDKLYADFVLNFFYNGKQLNVFDPNSSKVQTGIVMQKLELEKDSIGVGYNTDMKHYADKYINALPAAAEDAKKLILTGESSIESLTKQINNDRLDNKNRLQYYARFNNTEANANCVYRVYTYIKYLDESNNPVVKLGDPIYFTLYDVANATV